MGHVSCYRLISHPALECSYCFCTFMSEQNQSSVYEQQEELVEQSGGIFHTRLRRCQMMDELDKITNIEDVVSLKKRIAEKVAQVPFGKAFKKQRGHSNEVAKRLRNKKTLSAELQVAGDAVKAIHEQYDEESEKMTLKYNTEIAEASANRKEIPGKHAEDSVSLASLPKKL